MIDEQFLERQIARFQAQLNDPTFTPKDGPYYNFIKAIASKKCPACLESLNIRSLQVHPQGTTFLLECGHSFDIDKISDKTDFRIKGGSAFMRINDRKGEIEIHTDGQPLTKELDEVKVARSFIRGLYNDDFSFTQPEQNSPVDIVAEQAGLKIELQITRLFPEDFWKKLNVNKNVYLKDLSSIDLDGFIRASIDRKNKFEPKIKNQTILLINAWPLDNFDLLNKTEDLKQHIAQSGFKEVWLISPLNDSSIQLN